MTRELRCSARVLLHPLTLGALVVWALNDHVLKGWGPGLLTGKLSDFAALVVCPAVLLGLSEWLAPEFVSKHLRAVCLACCAAIGLLLIGLELSRSVELGYEQFLGSAQYGVKVVLSTLLGQPPPRYVMVDTTPDLGDLLSLPALAVPWWLLRRNAASVALVRVDAGRGREPQR